MKTILVSILSGQMIPNVLLARELEQKGEKISLHLAITTKQMQQQGKTEIFRKTIGIDNSKCLEICVEEDSIRDMKTQINKIANWEQFRAIVNITGGTKIMSMAAVESFRNKNARFLYLPIGKNRIDELDIKKGVISDRRPIEYQTSIREYLLAYGIEIISASTGMPDPTKTRWMSELFISRFDSLHPVLDKLRVHRKKKHVSPDEETQNLLNAYGWKWENPHTPSLSKKEIDFLTGGWLEDLVFMELSKKIPSVKEPLLARNVQIHNKNANNELDMIFIWNNGIHTVECKSVLNRDFLDETLYKIAALRKDFGLSTRSHLVVGKLGKDLQQEDGSPNKRFQNRTQVLRIDPIILEKDGIDALEQLIH